MRLVGTLTTDLGAIDSGRIGFVQDATDGIAIRLDAALSGPDPGRNVGRDRGHARLVFQPARRQRRRARRSRSLGSPTLPDPIGSTTGGAGEPLEGIRLSVEGVVTEAPGALTDGLGVTIDDG